MLDKLVHDRAFSALMKKHIEEMIIEFFNKEQNFGILCKIEDAHFAPELPEEMYGNLRAMTLFFLAGYTFESARIEDDMLVFEAGFGPENFGSVVSVPLLSIMQILVDETPVLINLAVYQPDQKQSVDVDEDGVQNSMASFLSNPENSKFLKK